MIDTAPSLSISLEKLSFIINKTREFDEEDVLTDLDEDSNTGDEAMMSVPMDRGEDPFAAELSGFIDSLTEDEQIDLVALAWLGRGDASVGEWKTLRQEAEWAHNKRTAAYLLGIPLLSDYLEDALAQFGCSREDFETGRL